MAQEGLPGRFPSERRVAPRVALGSSHPFGLPTAETSRPAITCEFFLFFTQGAVHLCLCPLFTPRTGVLGPSWVRDASRRLWGLRAVLAGHASRTQCCPRSCAVGWAEAPGSPRSRAALGAAPLSPGAASAAPPVCDRRPGMLSRRHRRTEASPTRVSCVAFSGLYKRFSG